MSEEHRYVPPEIREVGTLQEITLASNGGNYIDGNYPAHTPVHNHTS
ncbi:MAG TPA: lasso RiPP family leader peptide-containing protein [Acidimicrobiales bacterium]|nr:lasso RiPP family leader peptide-containing protein [Acidimicrobiales bacterium]